MVYCIPKEEVWKSNNSVENIIHLDRRPLKFWGHRLEPIEPIGKSSTVYVPRSCCPYYDLKIPHQQGVSRSCPLHWEDVILFGFPDFWFWAYIAKANSRNASCTLYLISRFLYNVYKNTLNTLHMSQYIYLQQISDTVIATI